MHYTGTIWRPPYEAGSLLLEATAGCTHHRCKFCTLYRDLPFSFRMTPLAVVEQDLQEAQLWAADPMALLAARLLGTERPEAVRRVFLTGANPFALKSTHLKSIAELVRRYLPSAHSIGCFARVTDVAGKTDEELADLRGAGYDGLTVGMETGDGEALAFMDKGYTAADILEQCQRLERADIRYSLFYLAGISGAGRGELGARATAAICNRLRPERIGANMLTVFPDSALWEEIRRGAWREAGEIEKYREIRTLVEDLEIPVRFAALGASNPVPLQGALPEDREALLAALDGVIEAGREEALRTYRRELPHL